MHGAALIAFPRFEGMDAVEPHAERVGAVRVEVGQRRGDPAAVPLLAVDGAGVAADANVEVDDEPKTLAARVVGQTGHRGFLDGRNMAP